MTKRGFILLRAFGLVLLLWLNLPQAVQAHAVLQRSTPQANTGSPEAPQEIRLWFTEPLEARFSGLELRNSSGELIKTAASQIDPTDAKQMFLPLEPLPEGLYTVVWRVVSAADGHHTAGSFPFTVGAAVAGQMATVVEEPVPWLAALVRWFNLLGLALAVGSLAFVLLVWQPLADPAASAVESMLQRVVWLGWCWLGVGGALMLLLQTATVLGVPLGAAWGDPVLLDIINGTRYGTLWTARTALWVLMGLLLWLAVIDRLTQWIALIVGCLILAVHSLYSHAAAAQAAGLAIFNDWFHLLMTALWLGGLASFFVVIGRLQRAKLTPVSTVARLTGAFSNYARVTMAGLVISGAYSAWLQVGTVEGLWTTLYGRALLVKLLLFAPLLGLAGVNLWLTQRRLRAGQAVWVGRLRGLMGAEIALVLGILLAVGGMTSISPARTVLAERTQAALAATLQPLAAPIFAMQMIVESDLHVQLTIAPGWVGGNTFTVALSTLDEENPQNEQPITDASLLRLRFAHQGEDLGRSELRITEGQNGLYTIQGANLSVPGAWQIRLTIQRPEQFDTVVDFAPQVPAAPPPPAPPPLDTTIPAQSQTVALWAMGLVTLIMGGYFVGQYGLPPRSRIGIVATALALLGMVFLAMGALP